MLGGISREKFVTLVTLAIMAQTRKTKNPNKLPNGKSYFLFGYVYGFISRAYETWPKPILKKEEEFEYSFEVVVPLIMLNMFTSKTMLHILECNESEEKYNYTIENYPNYKTGIQIGAEDAQLAFIQGGTPYKLSDGFLIPHEENLISKGCYNEDIVVVNKDTESFHLINDPKTIDEDIFKNYQKKTIQEINDYYDDLMKEN